MSALAIGTTDFRPQIREIYELAIQLHARPVLIYNGNEWLAASECMYIIASIFHFLWLRKCCKFFCSIFSLSKQSLSLALQLGDI